MISLQDKGFTTLEVWNSINACNVEKFVVPPSKANTHFDSIKSFCTILNRCKLFLKTTFKSKFIELFWSPGQTKKFPSWKLFLSRNSSISSFDFIVNHGSSKGKWHFIDLKNDIRIDKWWFFFKNCSHLLREKIVSVINKKFHKFEGEPHLVKAKNLQNVWDH